MGNLVGMFLGAWFKPWATMEAIRAEGYAETPGGGGISGLLANIKKYMMFVVVMGLVSGIITAVVGMVLPPEIGRASCRERVLASV